MKQLVIWDLDDTLFESDAIVTIRDRNWELVEHVSSKEFTNYPFDEKNHLLDE